jgi:hypothetical protein
VRPCLFIDGHTATAATAQVLKTINGIARHQTLLALSEMATDLSKPRLRLIKDFYFFLFQSSFLPYFSRSTSDFLLFFFFVIFRRFYMNNLISPITTTETNSPMDIVDYL